jgi:hypothetical protein
MNLLSLSLSVELNTSMVVCPDEVTDARNDAKTEGETP